MQILNRLHQLLLKIRTHCRALALLAAAVLFMGAPAAGSAQQLALVAVSPATQTAAPGQAFDVQVTVEGVEDLYAFEVLVHFPPGLVQVISVSSGGFLEPGLIALGSFNNQEGWARLIVSQKTPAEPKDGSGTLMTVRMQALEVLGSADLQIGQADLSDQNGMLIGRDLQGGQVRVCAGSFCYAQFLPLLVR